MTISKSEKLQANDTYLLWKIPKWSLVIVNGISKLWHETHIHVFINIITKTSLFHMKLNCSIQWKTSPFLKENSNISSTLVLSPRLRMDLSPYPLLWIYHSLMCSILCDKAAQDLFTSVTHNAFRYAYKTMEEWICKLYHQDLKSEEYYVYLCTAFYEIGSR